MKFETDSQTLKDLEIFGDKNRASIFSIFDSTLTLGGKEKLECFFKNPTNDIKVLINRQESICFLQQRDINLTFSNEKIEFVKHYLKQPRAHYMRSNVSAMLSGIKYRINQNNEHYIALTGVNYTIEFVFFVNEYLRSFRSKQLPDYLKTVVNSLTNILNDSEVAILIANAGKEKLGSVQLEYLDYTIRYSKCKEIQILFDNFYEFDAFAAIGRTALKLGFTSPLYLIDQQKQISLLGLFHPFVKNAIANNIQLNSEKTLYFLTGPNMGGKSTFIKSVGVALFLAHIGLPVPAQKMELTTFDGLLTSINTADNLTSGTSHFYEEVLRMKSVAEKIAEKKSIVAIFDELFKGTNVKDAFDASLRVLKSLAKVKNCFFIISTHVIEIGKELENLKTVDFKFLETETSHGKLKYNYRIQNGISDQRLGLKILLDQGIIEMIESADRTS
jgi:DNA mismatch repair protein MutS